MVVYVVTDLSPGDGYWGVWTEWSLCPPTSYARAFRLRFEPKQGKMKDDSGLNAVHIKCEEYYGNETRLEYFINVKII